MTPGFARWRVVHIVASGTVTLLALVHAALTLPLYRRWSPDAAWFLGTGLGLLLVGSLNLTHLGHEPCQRPTAWFVRVTNWAFAVFGALALVAIPEPQAYVLVAGLVAQAVAGHRTLPGPD